MRTHLKYNLFPSIGWWDVPPAKRALKLYEAGELDRRILLPTRRPQISVADAVERWPLDRL
jgi:hypothetical protein